MGWRSRSKSTSASPFAVEIARRGYSRLRDNLAMRAAAVSPPSGGTPPPTDRSTPSSPSWRPSPPGSMVAPTRRPQAPAGQPLQRRHRSAPPRSGASRIAIALIVFVSRSSASADPRHCCAVRRRPPHRGQRQRLRPVSDPALKAGASAILSRRRRRKPTTAGSGGLRDALKKPAMVLAAAGAAEARRRRRGPVDETCIYCTFMLGAAVFATSSLRARTTITSPPKALRRGSSSIRAGRRGVCEVRVYKLDPATASQPGPAAAKLNKTASAWVAYRDLVSVAHRENNPKRRPRRSSSRTSCGEAREAHLSTRRMATEVSSTRTRSTPRAADAIAYRPGDHVIEASAPSKTVDEVARSPARRTRWWRCLRDEAVAAPASAASRRRHLTAEPGLGPLRLCPGSWRRGPRVRRRLRWHRALTRVGRP